LTIKKFNQTIQNPEPLDDVVVSKIANNQGGYFSTPAFWYNRVSGKIYEDLHLSREPRFRNEDVVLDVEAARHLAQKYEKQGDLRGVQSAGISPGLYNWVDEYMDIREEAKGTGQSERDVLDKHIQQGGILKREDYLYVKTLMAETNLVLAIPPEHVLLQAVTVTPTTQTQFKWYKMDGSQPDFIQEDLDELTVPYTGAPAFTTDTAALKLYGSHTASTWEFRNEQFDVDVENVTLRLYAGQMDRKKQEIVARIINAVSGTGVNDWDALTGSANTNNPIPDFETGIDTIIAKNKGSPTEILSARAPQRAFVRSTPWVAQSPLGAATVNAVPYSGGVNYVAPAVQLLPGFTWYVDSFLTAEEVTIMAKEAIKFWDGPDRTISYANTQTEIEGTIFKSYFDGKVVDSDLMYKMTSVLS
jgi:hypothetical protein